MTEKIGERVPLSHCVYCGHALDGAFEPAGRHVPKEGDFSVCIECGTPMVYRADQTLRAMTPAEWAALKHAERMQIELAQAQVATLHTRRTSPAPHKKKPSARKK